MRPGILSSFLAGDPKRKWRQESYHHFWRVTEKQSEYRNPIIILGGWPKNKVSTGILSSFLAGDLKTKWVQESYHHSWRVTFSLFRRQWAHFLFGSRAKNDDWFFLDHPPIGFQAPRIICLCHNFSNLSAGDPKRKWGQESYHHSWRVTQKESVVRNPIIIFGGWPQKKVSTGILSSFLAGYIFSFRKIVSSLCFWVTRQEWW